MRGPGKTAAKRSAGRRGDLGLLLVPGALLCLAGVGTSCSEEPVTPLASLAAERPAATEALPEAPPRPVLVLTAAQVPALVELARPLVPLVVDPAGAAGANLVLDRVAQVDRVYLRVDGVELAVDEKTQALTIRSASALLVAWLGRGAAATELANTAAGVMNGLFPRPAGESRLVACEAADGTVVCRAGNGGTHEAAQAEAAEALAGKRAHMALTVFVPGLLSELERTVGVSFLWAAAPEDLGRVESVRVEFGRDEDVLSLAIDGRESRLLDAVLGFFPAAAPAAELPEGTPAYVVTALRDVPANAEKLDDLLHEKQVWEQLVSVRKQVDANWKTQTLQLAGGLAGVALMPEIPIDSPQDALVFLLQPTEAGLLDKRLRYVFSSKAFKTETVELRTGDKLTRVSERRSKKGAGTERVAWMHRGNTTYMSGSSVTLSKLSERLYVMPNKKKSPIILTLDGPRRLEARVSVRRLADGLVMSADGGFGAGMAVTMIRNAAQQVGHDITLSVTATRDDQTGRQAVRAEMRQAVTVLGTLLKYLGGFLQMAG